MLHLTPASKGHTVGWPVPSLKCCTLFRVDGPGHLACLAATVVSSSRPRTPCGLFRVRNVRVGRTTAARAADSLDRLPSGAPAADPCNVGPVTGGRGLTVDSVITGESLHDPPGLQCGGSSPAGPVGRPELDGSGTDGTFRVLRVRTIPVARRPAADSAKSRRTLTGRLRVGPAGAAAQGFGSPRYCGWGRLLPRSVPRGSRAVSTPGSVPSWPTGRQFPGSVPHGAQAVSSQNPVAHRPSVPRPAPPAP